MIPNRDPARTTVAVAMSGGVDSSVVAALLKEAGYNVFGITLQLYDSEMSGQKKGACCAGIDVYDAKSVSDQIGIPHYVLDYQSRFKNSVIDDFLDSYLRGETPTPCIRCNQSVKFSDLLEVAKSLNADCLATGHYAMKLHGSLGAELHKAKDSTKDQSYFLFATTPQQLSYLEFPLGNTDKATTRQEANRLGIRVANKPDSQDICFVSGSYTDLVKKLRPEGVAPGPIMHVDGYKLGQHSGIAFYTVGQRKGLGISHSEPLYVVSVDPVTNIVYVGPESCLYKTKFLVADVNFLGFEPNFTPGLEVCVKVRSTAVPIPARLHGRECGKVQVELLSKEKAITPGQACVFYQDSKVLGGGWIARQ